MRRRRLKRRAFWATVLLGLLLLALAGTVMQVLAAAVEGTRRRAYRLAQSR